MDVEGSLPNNPAGSMISSLHVYTRHNIMIYIRYTRHLPCICTNLDISPSKLMEFHIKWVTPGCNPTIQIWLELHCLEGVNVDSARVWHDACLQNSIERGCAPGFWQVKSGRHIELHSIVVCNPLSQFLGKKLQHGMAATVHVLNRMMLPGRIGRLFWHAEKLLLQEHNV